MVRIEVLEKSGGVIHNNAMLWPPIGAPMNTVDSNNNITLREDQPQWRHLNNSVSAVSFGFVATAILISMFLFMAIFERFLRPPPPISTTSATSATVSGGGGGGGGSGIHGGGFGQDHHHDIEAQLQFLSAKLGCSSPTMTVYTNAVSVLMPGENVPTFLAHPVPIPVALALVPCPPERVPRPEHTNSFSSIDTNSRSGSSSSSSSGSGSDSGSGSTLGQENTNT